MGSKYDAIGDFSVCGCVSIAWISEPATKSPPRRISKKLRMLKMFDINAPLFLFSIVFLSEINFTGKKKVVKYGLFC